MKLLIFAVLVVVVKCSLPVEKICGEITCPDHQFCSPIDHICRPCEQVCNSTLANYNYKRCEEGCQDYLHDMTYVRRNSTDLLGDLASKDDIESLRILLYIVLCTTVPTLIFILVFILLKLRKMFEKRKMMLKKKATSLPVIYSNKHGKEHDVKVMENNNENKRRSVRLEREPSESTLPDYSYDNPNLSHSPTPMNTV